MANRALEFRVSDAHKLDNLVEERIRGEKERRAARGDMRPTWEANPTYFYRTLTWAMNIVLDQRIFEEKEKARERLVELDRLQGKEA